MIKVLCGKLVVALSAP
ncbi:hypothetical protein ND920_03300 [Vibrio ordalii]|nr:hypothetical protein [Vibrio ordalii]MDV2315599.1 hypothetical protein [Vibrio cholerae]